MSIGGYPLGADYDPCAPWNYIEPDMEKCEACDGTGKIYYAYDIVGNLEIECTQDEWNQMPATEEEAEALGKQYARSDAFCCEACDGTGMVEI